MTFLNIPSTLTDGRYDEEAQINGFFVCSHVSGQTINVKKGALVKQKRSLPRKKGIVCVNTHFDGLVVSVIPWSFSVREGRVVLWGCCFWSMRSRMTHNSEKWAVWSASFGSSYK